MMLVRILLVVVAVCQGLRIVSRLGVIARASVLQTSAIDFGLCHRHSKAIGMLASFGWLAIRPLGWVG